MSSHRYCIRIGTRRVHVRRWGEGPAVLILHGSPQSSAAVRTQAETIAAQGACAIAIDTPGNGLSDPLPIDQPSIADYAAALAEVADALHLGRVGLYGYHTGAAIACAFAALYPRRVSAAAFDGLCCWTPAERADHLAHYLPPFQPTWDGAHMTWLWARLEEQTVFFPWYAPRESNRMRFDMPSPASLHANAIDFLDSGDGYRLPYAAAFQFAAEDYLPNVCCPILLGAFAPDPLRAHLGRSPLRERAPRVFDTPAGLHSAAAALFKAHPGDPAPAAAGAAPQSESGFLDLGPGHLYWRRTRTRTRTSAGAARPLLLLHDAGGSSRDLAILAARVGAARPVVTLDLPGHGASHEGWAAPIDNVVAFAEVIAAACAALGLDAADIAGLGLGGQIAARLAADGRDCSATLLGAVTADDPCAVSLKPEWDGAHLLRAFRLARRERLFEPWFLCDSAHAVHHRSLAPASIHARAIDLIKAHDRWTAACAARASYARAYPIAGLEGDVESWARLLTNYPHGGEAIACT